MGTPPDTAQNPPSAPSPPAVEVGTANPRYIYLVGRLRNRQMTMEEATELFGLMQVMVRTSELARQAAIRAMAAQPPRASSPSAPKPAAPSVPGGTPSADDLLLLGILGTGAAAGVLAALTKRIQELTDATSVSSGSKPGTGSK